MKLEDKVSDYIPEFQEMWVKSESGLKKAEKPITIQNLFSMTSGMNYDLNNPSILAQRAKNPNSSTLEMVRAMAGEPLEFEPGEHFKYSLSHDVLAAVVEVVSDMSFGEYLQKHIFDACGMTRTGFTLNEEIKEKMCSQYIYDAQAGKASLKGKWNQFILTPAYQSGGAGLISSLDDYTSFAKMLLNKGEINGNRVISEKAVKLISTPQVPESIMPGNERWRLGVRVITSENYRYLPVGTFGWSGAYGTHFWIDPVNSIAAVYMKNSMYDGGSGAVTAANFEKDVFNSFE